VVGVALEVPCVERTNFVERFRGGISAPRDGEYVFQLVSDGASELWLSPDHSPEKKVKIAEITGRTPYSKWPHSHEGWSAPVKLEANQEYYLEIWHLQKGGLGQLWVSWRRPDGVFEQPIPGAMLSRLEERRPKVTARTETMINREVGAE
jgi:hypothetical protein